MNGNGFHAARPISPAAVFRGVPILIFVTFVIAWAPRCEAGSKIRPVSGMGYTVFATGLAGPRGLLFSIEGLNEPRDPAFDGAGNLFVAETGAGRIVKMTGDY